MSFQVSQASFVVSNIMLAIGFFVGLPSNLVVLVTILRAPGLRVRATNLLIVNLCLTDLVTVFVDIPLMCMITFANYYHYEFNGLACDVQVFCHALGISAQASALVTIAYERYQSIANPFDKLEIKKRSLLFAAICWLTAIGLAVSQLTLARNTITHDICHMTVEIIHRPMKYIIVAYGAVAFLIIVLYYIGIIYMVKKHLHKFEENSTCPAPVTEPTNSGVPLKPLPSSDPGLEPGVVVEGDSKENSNRPKVYGEICVLNESNREKGKRKFEAEIAKRLFYIIASFLSVWLPYAVLVVAVSETDLGITSKPITFELLFCFHILTTLASALHPLIYALPNKQFRSTLTRCM